MRYPFDTHVHTPTLLGLRLAQGSEGLDRCRDVGEDCGDVRARKRDATDGHDRDQRDEQCVLEQILAFVLAPE